MKVLPFEDDADLLAAIAEARGTGPLAVVNLHRLRKVFKAINPTMKQKHGREMDGMEFKQIVFNVVGLWL